MEVAGPNVLHTSVTDYILPWFVAGGIPIYYFAWPF